jgi:pimeloyl-ACP methyl ester carboxylesterase
MLDGPSGALAVHDWGGDGQPVLLVHATGFHGHVWHPIAERLVDAGLHAWSIDQRGHGASAVPDRINDWEEFAADVLAMIAELGLSASGDLVGVGHSAGSVALLRAEANAPGTFLALWLYEPVILPVEPPLGATFDNPLAAGARRRREAWPSKEEAIASYGARPPFNVLRADVLRAYVDHGLVAGDDGLFHLACPPEIEAQTYERMTFHDMYSHLAEVHCPTIVAAGNPESPGSLAQSAPALVQRLPHGRHEPMPELGHFGPLQDPDRIVASVLPFVAEVSMRPA